MSKLALTSKEISEIKNLRRKGHTVSEIKHVTKKSKGTIWKYIRDVAVSPKYQKVLQSKKGGSKAKSERDWSEARDKAKTTIQNIGFSEKMLILSCLYWGEGNKTELNVINSDPAMIRVIISCLKELGVQDNELKLSLRLFEDIDKKEAISFWSGVLNLPKDTIQKIDVIKGNKVGKLKYGMCRLRVKKGAKYFKFIISMIDLIRSGV